MELTPPIIDLLQQFAPVFTVPTFQTFLEIVTGWVLSHLHRYVTEVIFAGGNIGNGHWCRFHRFFSHTAWDLDHFAAILTKLVVTMLAPDATLFWAVDDTLCHKRGLTLYGAGMHYAPLIFSRAKSLVSWGHDWVVLCLIIANPLWAPTKVFSLPIAVRLYRNRHGLTKGKKGSHLPPNVHLISHVHPQGALYERAPIEKAQGRGAPRKKGHRLPGMAQWANDSTKPWTELKFNQFGLHATLAVKTIKALYYKAGGDRELSIVLVHDLEGKRPDQMFYCTKLDWSARQILSAYSYRWAIECTFENCKQFLGLEDPANRLPKAVARTAPFALFLYSLVVVWFHKTGHQFVRFPNRPWYRQKREPSFADLLTTLRRVSLEEKTRTVLPNRSHLKSWLTQITDLLSRTG